MLGTMQSLHKLFIIKQLLVFFKHAFYFFKNDVCEIIEKRHAYRSSRCIEKEIEEEQEQEFQEKYAHMPNVGTRVRRGRDWKWKNQDAQGAGTVTGHSNRCMDLFIVFDFL